MISKISQLSAVSRIFSSAVFRELAKTGRSPLFARLLSQTDIRTRCSTNATVADAFDAAFSVLRMTGARDEYVYRAALTHKVLMGTHTLKTACMLNEFRAGECKADLVILNGTATVYEIKSERDSLGRLARQMENYAKVFAKVFVIAGEPHVRSVLDLAPDDVGVLCLSRRHQISTVRDAADRPERICPATLFDSLRVAEARAVLLELGLSVPDVPNTLQHAALREAFSGLRPTDAHFATVSVLKRTRDLAPLCQLIERLPYSLHAAALSVRVRRTDHCHLVNAVETPLHAAMAWA